MPAQHRHQMIRGGAVQARRWTRTAPRPRSGARNGPHAGPRPRAPTGPDRSACGAPAAGPAPPAARPAGRDRCAGRAARRRCPPARPEPW
ncbi:hypothetical protein G6F51_014684 [Rhizopus arrhizus]|uniref:Uncharacterized protein n=1 Tax=Rhizopus oryzae TaxID=64495 RepID=A0A9P6XLB6_RHIOR|nr:hypothetical protein G6F51_014684 [Rhizopus arrhizus]